MLVIGITGGSGSGKSRFSAMLADLLHAPILDADATYHRLVSEPSACTAALASAFGENILSPDGSLDRPSLAAVVFADGQEAKEKLKKLNTITHCHVLAEFQKQLFTLKKQQVPYVLLDVPLLFEAGFDALCDRTVCVLADREIRLSRIMARDGINTDAAIRRLQAGSPDEFYTARGDMIVYNNGDEDALREKIQYIADNV